MPSLAFEDALVLGPEMAGTLMAPEEFDAVEEVDEEFVYELIHGVLVVSPPPSPSERGANQELGYLLFSHQEHHAQGSALDATLPEHYMRTHDSRRRADRAIWAGLGRVPHPKDDVPTIVVEFVSAGKRNRYRDYVEKRREYLALGVLEYWVFDRFRRIMTVYKADGREVVVPEDGTYRTDLLPGFELPLSRPIETADRWDQP